MMAPNHLHSIESGDESFYSHESATHHRRATRKSMKQSINRVVATHSPDINIGSKPDIKITLLPDFNLNQQKE